MRPVDFAVRIGMVLVLFALGSCREPASVEQFIAREDCTADGYRFGVDLGDSTAVYDLSFYGRLDGNPEDMPPAAVPVTVTWVSPSLVRFTETVYLDVSGTSRTYFSRQFSLPYRRAVSMNEPGWWQLTVDARALDPLTGLGLRVIKTNSDLQYEDGTRQTP